MTFTPIRDFAKRHAPELLSAAGVGMLVGASAYTCFASFKSAKEIRMAEEEREFEENAAHLSTPEKISLVWRNFIPSAALIFGGVACIVGSNKVSLAKIEALGASLALATVKNDIPKSIFVDNTPATDYPPWVEKGSDGLIDCMDGATGRVFRSSKERIDAAVNRFNAILMQKGIGTLNDFFDELDLPPCKIGEAYAICYQNEGKLLQLTYTWGNHPDKPNDSILIFDFDEWDINPKPYTYRLKHPFVYGPPRTVRR